MKNLQTVERGARNTNAAKVIGSIPRECVN